MKKLAFIMPTLNSGGAERIISTIIKNLDISKYDINLILIKKEGKFLVDIPEHVKIIDINKSRFLTSIPALYKQLELLKPDLIFSSAFHINATLPSIISKLSFEPKLIIREPSTPSRYLGELSPIRKKITKIFMQSQYRKANLIIAQCEEMKMDLIEELSIQEEKIKYIYNPIDIETIRKNMKDVNPYDDNDINYVAVGRLSFEKGFDILLEAFKIVVNHVKNSKLTIVGEGKDRSILENKIEELGLSKSVNLIGFKENPYPYIYYSDSFVLSSRWEGFPNALLEALATGAKVIAFDCKSGPREILDNGKYGKLVSCGNELNLAQEMISYIDEKSLTDDRHDFFTIEKIILEYEKTFDDILEEKIRK